MKNGKVVLKFGQLNFKSGEFLGVIINSAKIKNRKSFLNFENLSLNDHF